MSGGGVKQKVRHNDRTMANTLPSTESLRHWDNCCGIHGAARRRKGEKHGTVCARRRHDKEVIQQELEELNDEQSLGEVQTERSAGGAES